MLLSIPKGGAISYSRKGWVTPERRRYGPYKLQEDKIPRNPGWRISSAHEQALVSACNNTDSDRWVELYETLTLLPGVNDRQVKRVSFLLFDPSLPTRELTIWSVVTWTEMAMCCYFGNQQGGWEGLLHGRGKVFNKCQSLSCSREESSIHFNAHPAFTVVYKLYGIGNIAPGWKITCISGTHIFATDFWFGKHRVRLSQSVPEESIEPYIIWFSHGKWDKDCGNVLSLKMLHCNLCLHKEIKRNIRYTYGLHRYCCEFWGLVSTAHTTLNWKSVLLLFQIRSLTFSFAIFLSSKAKTAHEQQFFQISKLC